MSKFDKNFVDLMVEKINKNGCIKVHLPKKVLDRINKYYPDTYKITETEYGLIWIVKI